MGGCARRHWLGRSGNVLAVVAVVAAAVPVASGCVSRAALLAPRARAITWRSPVHLPSADPGPDADEHVASPERSPLTISWRIAPDHRGGIAGYANRTSVTPGQAVRVYVSTRAPSFVVRAFRMGFYGGREGVEVWRSVAIPGHIQPGPQFSSPATRTITAPWSPSLTIPTARWPAGDYLLRLDASNGGRSYVPLTVRSASAAGKLVLISPVTTWQAYNSWGCCDLYQGADGSFSSRSFAVSFDRPYQAEAGAGQFLRDELPILALAAQLHLPLDYVTDIDLQQHPHLLDGASAVISMGHDEYWSPRMRDTLTTARNAGTNLAFFGANAIFRRVRFAPTALGPDRLEINYKIASQDPLNGVDNAAVTADWPAWPDPDPESALLGAQYACNLGSHAQADGIIADPTAWPFATTGVHSGQALPGLIGPETDAVQLNYPTPRPLQILLHSPTPCPGATSAYADTTYYTTPSGAGIFDAGTIAWACAIDNACATPVPPVTETIIREVTSNILSTFAGRPAGTEHPAIDNLETVGFGG
jgi:hypothetical protein